MESKWNQEKKGSQWGLNSQLGKVWVENICKRKKKGAIITFTHKSYVIKLKLSPNGKSSVEHEYGILKKLIYSNRIPWAYWFGREGSYDILVLDLLSPSLHDLIHKHKKFYIYTIAHIAEQLVSQFMSTGLVLTASASPDLLSTVYI